MKKFNRGDEVEIISNIYGNHRFPIGTVAKIINSMSIVGRYPVYDCCTNNGDCCYVSEEDLELINVKSNKMIQAKKQAVLDTANKLLKAQNTVTTLEIKTQLIIDYPEFFWKQDFISQEMDVLYSQGLFTYSDNGTFRTYSAYPVPLTVSPTASVTTPRLIIGNGLKTLRGKLTTKPSTISRKKAYDLMINNKGHFFTAIFIKQDGTERVMNCQYMKDGQSTLSLGYIRVKETGKLKTGVNPIRQINLQTLISLKIAGNFYKIRK